MLTHRLPRHLIAAALATVMGAAAVAGTLPPPHTEAGITLLSGGIGSDEAHALEAEAAHWPATLEFAVHEAHHDAFLAGVPVQVRDARQRLVLDTVSSGPLLLARLQPGRYQVTARWHGRPIERTLVVRAGHPVRQVFVWPQADARAAG